jgi:hypothetical protein
LRIHIIDPRHIDRLIFLHIEERSGNAADWLGVTTIIVSPAPYIATVIELGIVRVLVGFLGLYPHNVFINFPIRVALNKALKALQLISLLLA